MPQSVAGNPWADQMLIYLPNTPVVHVFIDLIAIKLIAFNLCAVQQWLFFNPHFKKSLLASDQQ
jgi:hypothetical protein